MLQLPTSRAIPLHRQLARLWCLACLKRMAAERPAGPAPTTSRSKCIDSRWSVVPKSSSTAVA